MSRPATFTAIVLEKILGFLAPLFADDNADNPAAARQAARETLASYGARNDRELRLAALSIAFGFGALDALCRASNPTLALNQVLRLRGNANALNRAANQTENKLEKLRKQLPEAMAADPAPPDDLPTTSATPDLLAFARACPAPARQPLAPAPMVSQLLSRQQRRAAERSAEKLRRQQQAAAERTRRAAERSVTYTSGSVQVQPAKAAAATSASPHTNPITTAQAAPAALASALASAAAPR